MKKTLKQLEAEFEINSKEGFRLRDEIKKFQIEKAIPKLRIKYEGKFWKYQNRTSLDHDKWWLYSYCITIISDREGVFDTFQSGPYQDEFQLEVNSFFYLCEIEITKDEYLKALTEFQNKVMRLNKFV